MDCNDAINPKRVLAGMEIWNGGFDINNSSNAYNLPMMDFIESLTCKIPHRFLNYFINLILGTFSSENFKST